MKYFIMRHGSTSLNIKKKMQGRIDVGMSKKGMLEIHHASKILLENFNHLNYKKVLIYSSTLKRARETTDIVSKKLAVENIECEIKYSNLLEEMSFGEWEGKSKNEISKELLEQRSSNIWNFKIPMGESYKDVYERTNLFFEKNREEIENSEPVLFISHEKICQCLDAIINKKNKNYVLLTRYNNGEIKKYERQK